MQIVADYSSLVSGVVSRTVEEGEIVIPVSVVSFLESEMRANKADGFVGISELQRLKERVDMGGLELRFTGDKPRKPSLEDADWDARETAMVEQSTLLTCSELQKRLAEPLGINVLFLEQEEDIDVPVSKFFDENTMSVHIKEDMQVFAKKGFPGSWKFTTVTDEKLDKDTVESLAREIVERAERNPKAFIEVDKEGATVIQYDNYRIVITRHPFSNGTEITAVRPVKKLTLDDYNLDESLLKRFKDRAEGIVIAGSPGAGKTTIAQALAEFYAEKGKIVKTIEHPRDLNVQQGITQYGHLEGDPEGTGEVLLLVRPDFTVYDELRTTRDFNVYSDMRLAGVGMIGVVHASRAIDAVQRFLGRLEMGVIPQVLDTVVYLDGGEIVKVYELEIRVKVPSGMMEADLARPVVVIKDFFTKEDEYEIYAFGEETSIVPVEDAEQSPLQELAKKEVEHVIRQEISGSDVKVHFTGDRGVTVYVNDKDIPRLIGKGGSHIEEVEERLGLSIDVQDIADAPKSKKKSKASGRELDFRLEGNRNTLYFYFDKSLSGEQVEFYVDGDLLFSPIVSKKGRVKLTKKTKIGKVMEHALNNKRDITVRA